MGLLNFLITQLWFVVLIAIALVIGVRQFHTKQLIPALVYGPCGEFAGDCDWVCGDAVENIKKDEQMFLKFQFLFGIM